MHVKTHDGCSQLKSVSIVIVQFLYIFHHCNIHNNYLPTTYLLLNTIYALQCLPPLDWCREV